MIQLVYSDPMLHDKLSPNLVTTNNYHLIIGVDEKPGTAELGPLLLGLSQAEVKVWTGVGSAQVFAGTGPLTNSCDSS